MSEISEKSRKARVKKPVIRTKLVNLKVTQKEYEDIRKGANEFANGNISAYMRSKTILQDKEN